MALVSESSASGLDMAKNRRLSFREDLNDHHDDDFDGFSSDEEEEEEDDHEEDDETSKDPDTAEIASMERKALKYRKSLTMLNQFAGLKMTPVGGDDRPNGGGNKDHLLAAKKSIDDLTAWVNAAALEGDDDPFGGDDD